MTVAVAVGTAGAASGSTCSASSVDGGLGATEASVPMAVGLGTAVEVGLALGAAVLSAGLALASAGLAIAYCNAVGVLAVIGEAVAVAGPLVCSTSDAFPC